MAYLAVTRQTVCLWQQVMDVGDQDDLMQGVSNGMGGSSPCTLNCSRMMVGAGRQRNTGKLVQPDSVSPKGVTLVGSNGLAHGGVRTLAPPSGFVC